MGSGDLPEGLVEDLARPAAYPDDPTAARGVERIQTHLSHLYLTSGRVVKLRKPVRLPFVDFTDRSRRIADCHDEVALNRRLAPDVYLGVARVVEQGGRFGVEDKWEPHPGLEPEPPRGECVVVMRRLEGGRDALSLLERGELAPGQLDSVATKIARFHAHVGLGSPAPWSTEAWWDHCWRPVDTTLQSLSDTAPDAAAADAVRDLAELTRRRFDALRDRLEARRREGRVVEGHGDLHLQHIWFERGAAEPVMIDCVEFDPALRRIDAASEVAFLAMDLDYRGRRDLAEHFLRRYAANADDFGLYGVVDFFQSYRAAVRGKVAALAAVDPAIPAEQRESARASALRHLALAREAIEPRDRGALALVCGTVGVGKSTVAEELAERAGGVLISSDWTRKHMEGLRPDARRREAIDRGLYSADRKEAVYAGLLERAEAVVASGRLAVVDATFDRRARRDRARTWAAEHASEALLIRVDCEAPLARQRLERRVRRGVDASDAGPELLEASRAGFEAPTEWPEADRYEVRTDGEVSAEAIRAVLARLDRSDSRAS